MLKKRYFTENILKKYLPLLFTAVTVFYILTRWLIFKGFNGPDDLHFARLASQMICGSHDPFQPGDIFSGRILHVATQALINKLGGINVVTTQEGSLIVVILSCYLNVFPLLPVKNATTVVLASSLFYSILLSPTCQQALSQMFK